MDPSFTPNLDPSSDPSPAPTMAPTMADSPEMEFFDSFVNNPIIIMIAAVCAVLAIFISGYNVIKHLTHYSKPHLQRSIVRILLMVPLYAALSFAALAFKDWHVILDTVRNVYEAFVVYCFLNLMLSYCGGEGECVSVIMNDPGSITHAWPLSYCLPRIALSARFLRFCKQLALQFVIVKPIMAVLDILVSVAGTEVNFWSIVEVVVYNTSYTLALYALILFYKATRRHPGLEGQYPVLKFLTVKLVVFATYYQTMILEVVPAGDVSKVALTSFNNFVLCCEMVIFAAVQYFAFSYKPFLVHDTKSSSRVAQAGPGDLGPMGMSNRSSHRAEQGAFGNTKNGADRFDVERSVANNAKEIVNVKDVAVDAYYNFYNKYGDHVLLDSDASPNGIELSEGSSAKNTSESHDDDANPFHDPRFSSNLGDSGVLAHTSGGKYDVDIDLTGGDTNVTYDTTQTKLPDIGGLGLSGEASFDGNPFAKDLEDPLHIRRGQEPMEGNKSSRSASDKNDNFDMKNSHKTGAEDQWFADFNDSKKKRATKARKKRDETHHTIRSEI